MTSKLTLSNFILDRSSLKLYYDQFKYKMIISIPGIHLFRLCDTIFKMNDRIDAISNRKWTYYEEGDTFKDLKSMENIRKFIKWRSRQDKITSKLTIGNNRVIIYSNQLDVFQDLMNQLHSSDFEIFRQSDFYYVDPIPNYQKDVIYLKEPKYKFRIYIRSEKYEKLDKIKLQEFLNHYNVSLCPSFKKWINNSVSSSSFRLQYAWAWNHYFFEFDDESLITIISLKFDNLIGKICTVQKR